MKGHAALAAVTCPSKDFDFVDEHEEKPSENSRRKCGRSLRSINLATANKNGEATDLAIRVICQALRSTGWFRVVGRRRLRNNIHAPAALIKLNFSVH